MWVKSSYSGNNGNCVEVTDSGFPEDGTLVRDSKNPNGPYLRFTWAEWDAFVKGVKNGEFD